jgi:hypothetical protein
MSSGLSDTSPDVERVLLELARKAPPWRKVELMGEMYRTVRELALSGLRQRHPNESPAALHRRLADILLGGDLASCAYGPISEERSRDAV